MTSSVPERERVNILVVDDVVQNLVVLREILQHPDYAVVTATSGRDALRYMLNEEFAVVLLDVAMPGLDGFEVARAIKERPRSAETPIIFLTALRKDVMHVYRGYSAGGVDYLEKPLDPEVVRAKVAVFVELFRRRRELLQKSELLARQTELLRESERREQEYRFRELERASQERYRNLAESIPQIVWRAGPRGEAEYFNGRWMVATGLEVESAMGNGWFRALHPDDFASFERLWVTAVEAGTPFQTECRLGTPNGSYRWYLCQALPERGFDHTVVAWLGTFTDIETQKQAEVERAGLLAQAQAAIRLRDEFLSVASHELKTPLTSLTLQLETLERKLANGKASELDEVRIRRVLDVLLRQNFRLAALINDLLDVSKISTGRLSLETESFDLHELLADVIARFDDSHERPAIRCISQPGLIGKWDRSRLDQVITNLVSNAIKYGEGKPIDVTAAAAGDRVLVTVVDRGIGVAPDSRERIFERFERAVTSRTFSGLGLGLYIVREIVRAHGGTVSVDSQEGAGSTFRIDLPFAGQSDEVTLASPHAVNS